MAKILIIVLGKGQQQLKIEEYRKAHYILPQNPSEIKTTPFVGEAIISLVGKESFDKVFILGTNDSMWHTLYAHCVLENESDEDITTYFNTISEEVSNRELSDTSQKLIEKEFETLSCTKTAIEIIPIGKNEDELWSVFETISKIPQQNDIVSIDITNGLRYQPLFLFLGLFYFKTILNNKIKNVFYGALELSAEFPALDEYGKQEYETIYGKQQVKNLTPIFDLKPLIEIMDWINASNTFKQYGDLSLFIKLLQDKNIDNNLIVKAKDYAQSLQLNNVENIKSNSTIFKNKIKEMLENVTTEIKPLKFVEEAILDFPNQINLKNNSWEIMWLMSERYYKSGQLALATILLFEAIISRIAKIYLNNGANIDESKIKDSKFCSEVARSQSDGTENVALRNFYNQNQLANFPVNFAKLGNYRNGLAHVRGNEHIEIENLPNDFPKLYKYFKSNINNTNLENLPNIYKHPSMP